MARIIVCDDAKFLRDVLVDMLKSGGHDVVAAVDNGDEAVAKYKDLRPDIVTMDLIMRTMGTDAIREIMEFDPKAKVVVVSVLGEQEEQVVKAIKLGALGIVAKPVKKELLLAEVERVLKK